MNPDYDDWKTASGYSENQGSVEDLALERVSPALSRAGLLILPLMLLTAMLIAWPLLKSSAVQAAPGNVIYVTGSAVAQLKGGEPVLLKDEIIGEVAEVTQQGDGTYFATLALKPEIMARLSGEVDVALSSMNEWWPGNPVVTISTAGHSSSSVLEPGTTVQLKTDALATVPWKFLLVVGSGVLCLAVVVCCIRSLQRALTVVRVLKGLIAATIGGVWLYFFVSRLLS